MSDPKAPKSKKQDRDPEADVRALLKIAGPRAKPPVDAEQRTYQKTLQAWEALSEQPYDEEPAPQGRVIGAHRGWQTGLALAASILVAVVSLGYFERPEAPQAVAQLVYQSGEYRLQEASSPLINGSGLVAGSMLSTRAGAKLLLQLDSHTRLRMDENTSATFQSSSEVWLHSGRVYIDSEDQQQSVQIITPLGTVRDIGTQFEVALVSDALQVAVREGQVTIKSDQHSLNARAYKGQGELVTLDARRVERKALAVSDKRWHWIHSARAEFELSDSNLREFMLWASREAGLSLRFASKAAEMAAGNTRLYGDIGGLAPEQAIPAILQTTGFIALPSEPHEIVIGFKR